MDITTSGIDNVSNVNTGGSSNSYVYYQHSENVKKNDKFALLRAGEIVLGSVINIIQSDLANIKIPIGTFSAKVHQNLKQGDELFFYVEEVSPNLVLRVHSVNVISNKRKLSNKEIIRVLDLPANELINFIVDYTKSQTNRIIRNDILLIEKFMNFFNSESDLELMRFSALKTLYFMRIAGIDSNIDIFKKLYSGFNGEIIINDLFRNFIEVAQKLPQNASERILRFTDNCYSKVNDFSDLFGIFHKSKNENLYSLLKKIVSISSKNLNFIKLKEISNKILEILDSQYLHNFISLNKELPFRLFFPMNYNDISIISILLISNSKSASNLQNIIHSTSNENLYFDFLDLLSNHTKLKPKIIRQENISELQNYLRISGLILQSVIIYDNGEEIDLLKNSHIPNQNSISIVV